MKPLSKEKVIKDYQKFKSNFSADSADKILYFKPFQCPVAIASAMVTEKQVQDYSVFSLLLLRLIKAGFGRTESLISISGMGRETVQSFITKAIIDRQCECLDNENPEKGVRLLPLGEETLLENESAEADSLDPQAHVMYRAPRKLHIEALTGTVIPSYMEMFMNDVAPDEEQGPSLLPRKDVELDAELCREIKSRINEYVGLDRITSGDVVQDFDFEKDISSERIFFRWAYLVKLKNMKYPMIVMTGKKQVEKLNQESKKKNNFDIAVLPVAVSRTDSRLLMSCGEAFGSVLVREDIFFEYLASNLFPVENGDLPLIAETFDNVTSIEEIKSEEGEE